MIASAASRFRLINLREMYAHRGRTGTSLGVVAVAAALLVAIIGIYGSITGSVAAVSEGLGGDANIEVTSVADSGMSQDLVAELRRQTGVASVAPIVRQPVGVGGDRIVVLGIDAGIRDVHSPLANSLQEQIGHGLPTDGVIAGPGLGVKTGDMLHLGTWTERVAVVVDGDAARALNGGRFAVSLIGIAQRLTDRPRQIDSIFVVAKPGTDIAQLQSDLRTVVAGRAVVATPQFRSVQTSNAMALARYSTLLVGAIALVVSGFLVFNSMNMTAAQRRPRIASLLALGGEPRSLSGDLVIEAALLGVIGGLIGIPIGLVAGMVAVRMLPPFLVQTIDAHIDYVVPLSALPLVLLATTLTTVIASIIAARSVLRTTPIEAMAGRDISDSEERDQPLRRSVGVIAVICLAAAALLAVSVHDQRAIAAAALCAAGGLAAAYALQRWLTRAAVRVAAAMGSSGILAATVIKRAPRRAWATAMTVALVVAVGTATSGALTNMTNAGIQTVSALGDTDAFISATTKDMIPTGPLLPDDLAARVAAVPGVTTVLPVQYAYVNLGTARVLMEGADARSTTPAFHAMTPEVREQVSRGDGVVLSRQLAKTFKLSVGDTLQFPSATGLHSARILQVIDYVTLDAGLVAISLDVMQRWLRRDGATYLEVQFARDADTADTMRAVREVVPPTLSVYTGQEALDATRGIFAQIGVLAVMTQWIVALIGAIAVLNTLMLSVMDRRRELGVLRALGASQTQTSRVVLCEALSLGLVGGVIGVVFGEILHYLGTVVLGAATSIVVPFTLSLLTPVYIVTALVICLAGAYPPARRAAQLNIIDAISDE